MSVELERNGDTLHVGLAGELLVGTVSELHERLQAELSGVSLVTLDAAAVSRLDASMAQLFAWLGAQVPHFELRAASPAWVRVWEELGLNDPLPGASVKGVSE